MPVSEYDANGALVTALIGRLMIGEAMRRHVNDAYFAMRIEQKISVENIGIVVDRVIITPLKGDPPDLGHIPPMTFCGRPIVIDETLPLDVIELRDKTGGVLAKVKNLAAPKEY